MNGDPALLEELIGSVSPAYEIFRTAGPEARELVDTIVSERLRIPAGFAMAGALGADALRTWGATAAGARPYRNSMQAAVQHFPAWWRGASVAQQAAMARHLPALGPALGDLGESGVRDLIAGGEAALACAAAYSLTTGDAVVAIARIARAAESGPAVRDELLAALSAAFPPERMAESRDAERFLPALERVVAAAGEAWEPAVRLALALVATDPSSAYGVCLALPRSIQRTADRRTYLEDFLALVRAIGNRAAGVCLSKLAAAREPAKVAAAVQAADRYGALAGEHLLTKLFQ